MKKTLLFGGVLVVLAVSLVVYSTSKASKRQPVAVVDRGDEAASDTAAEAIRPNVVPTGPGPGTVPQFVRHRPGQDVIRARLSSDRSQAAREMIINAAQLTPAQTEQLDVVIAEFRTSYHEFIQTALLPATQHVPADPAAKEAIFREMSERNGKIWGAASARVQAISPQAAEAVAAQPIAWWDMMDPADAATMNLYIRTYGHRAPTPSPRQGRR